MTRRIALVIATIGLFSAAIAAKPVRNQEPLQKADLRAPMNGTIAKVLVKEDESVKKGELLFELKDTKQRESLARALATTEEGKALLAEATARLRRAEILVERKAIGREEYLATLADCMAAQAKMQQIGLVVDKARKELEQTRVYAPFAGKVVKLHVSAGADVSDRQTVLITIHEMR